MKRNISLYDLPEDDLAALARQAAVRAVRKIRAAGLTPAGIESAVRRKRVVAARQSLPAPLRRVRAVARSA